MSGFDSGFFDSLVGDSTVRLFGRIMWDIQLTPHERRTDAYGNPSEENQSGSGAVPLRRSSNNFLIDQLSRQDARLARISSFSYQSEMVELVKPAIFLVHGNGQRVELFEETNPDQLTLKNRPTYTERSGMVAQQGSFAFDIFVWVYDRADYTLRLDTESGSFDSVLLARELGGAIDTASMQSAGTDPPPPPRPRRRRWRSDGK